MFHKMSINQADEAGFITKNAFNEACQTIDHLNLDLEHEEAMITTRVCGEVNVFGFNISFFVRKLVVQNMINNFNDRCSTSVKRLFSECLVSKSFSRGMIIISASGGPYSPTMTWKSQRFPRTTVQRNRPQKPTLSSVKSRMKTTTMK